MKNLLLLLALFTISTITAQWETKYYVDEFGDLTKDKYETFMSEGVFSNSAIQNTKAIYRFIKDDELLTINVFEYGSSLATSIEATFEEVKIKGPNRIETIKKVFFSKEGSLYFNKKLFTTIKKFISSPGDYTMIFKRTGSYSSSSYKVKFTIE